jgi:hypothetical protein
MRPLTLTAATLLLLTTGCARYEYDLVQPADLARHIGRDRDEVIRIDPLEYRLRSYENRLVMEIFNPTGDPITLAGDRSYVVDPGGQSHPLRSQAIAPSAFIKLILPPMRPYYRSSPSIGFGLGVGFSSRGHFGRRGFGGVGFHDPFWDEPHYATYYDESDTTYWTWEGETDARLHLVFLRGNETFADDFTFHRRKM